MAMCSYMTAGKCCYTIVGIGLFKDTQIKYFKSSFTPGYEFPQGLGEDYSIVVGGIIESFQTHLLLVT